MITRHMMSLGVLAAMAVVCASLQATARGETADTPAASGSQASASQERRDTQTAAADDDAGWASNLDERWSRFERSRNVVRFGYWGTQSSGSPVKTGEYQDLGASPFFDIDGLTSDGKRTADYTITGTDAESDSARLNFYRENLGINLDYQRFPHELLHENLGEFPWYTASGAQQFRRQDANPGEDYAIRVQEFKGNVKWRINDRLKARVDVWGMKKEGERDARAMQECYAHNNGLVPDATPGKNCHNLAQMQHIDWQTTEVKPIIELNLDRVVVEYSRPMRVFSQNDQSVYRYYDSGGTAAGEFGVARFMEYGVVPDSDTQTDQLKISADLNDCNKVYAFLFNGNTHKESHINPPIPGTGVAAFDPLPADERIGNRHFDGADVRWTNKSLERVTVTTYGRTVGENNEPAAFTIPGEETRPGTVGSTSVPVEDDPTGITPINYQRSQAGTKMVWRPFCSGFAYGGLAINAGYEYSVIHRVGLEVDTGSDDPPFQGTIIEENTRSNIFTIGPSMRWSPQFDTYLRYKWCNTQDPLFATNSHADANYTALALNSALPTHSDLIELGGTWMPSEWFLVSGWFGIDIQSQNIGRAVVQNQPGKTTVTNLDAPAGFASQSFPFGVNGVYRASDRWNLNGGFAYYTNFIDQDVAFGAGADHSFPTYGLLQNQWGFSSRASVYTIGSTYDLTCNVRLVGMIEYIKAIQSAVLTAGDPRFPGLTATTAGIPQNFRQDVDSTRISAGVDWRWSAMWSSYFRYVLYDYRDHADEERFSTSTSPITGLPLSGTSNMFLGGVSAVF